MPTYSAQDVAAFRAYHRERDERRRQEREELRLDVLEKTRAAIRRLAPEFPAVHTVHLFGSILQPGRFTSRSDVDLAVDIEDLEQEGPFARALEKALDRPVDVRPHRGPIRRAVETEGEAVYARETTRS